MLTVWGRRTSSNVQAVMWCIGELGLPCRRHDVGHRFGGTDTAEFIAMNPNRTVPVLQDGGNPPLWESGAILRYLASRYGKGPFWPEALLPRTEVDRWAEWAKINVAMGFTGPVFGRLVRTPAGRRDGAAIARAVAALERKLAIAEAQIGAEGFLAGPEFTLADIQFGHVLYRYYDIDIARAELPHLAAYYARLTGRPAYREHVMLSYDELRA
ncbi:glutathione S-transferase family protein [Pseudodonghicola flavimaris]|uniref:Glutathione S-transferase N-terminal domain-containing protein n=1 Tax=Pseudodonghicola flavimaris TaxID=3050036 RepID=A0ABT7EUU7_9RHOB|nr:glutathione S-transferase N-terminal domain-containing protein [Pseudodonghicola flavimaris]MDK3016116.1 glutathione S-transferase N-terminal domain-containing protein [Pseudodonghicola flavimaris]